MKLDVNFSTSFQGVLSFHKTLAIMIFPNDTDKQNSYVFTSIGLLMDKSDDEMRAWFDKNGGITRLSQEQPTADFDDVFLLAERDWKTIYWLVLLFARAIASEGVYQKQVSLTRASKILADHFKENKNIKAKNGRYNIITTWSKWRPVAHLVAAFMINMRQVEAGKITLSTIYKDYGEWIRHSYELQKALKSIKSLKLDDQMYEFSDEIKQAFDADDFKFILPPFTENEKKIWRSYRALYDGKE